MDSLLDGLDPLMDRPKFVRLQQCVSERTIYNIWAPQGAVLSRFLSPAYTSDFQYRVMSSAETLG